MWRVCVLTHEMQLEFADFWRRGEGEKVHRSAGTIRQGQQHHDVTKIPLYTNMGLQGLTLKLEWSCAKQLLLFLTHRNNSFNAAILGTDHEKHPLMLRVSFKERGIILLI